MLQKSRTISAIMVGALVTATPLSAYASSPLIRLTNAQYTDGIAEPRGGTGAVSARAISNAVAAQDSDKKNARGLSDMLWNWGQFIDHDISLTESATPTEPYSIAVPTGDPYFDPFATGTATIGFSRSAYDPSTGTDESAPREQLNSISAVIDASNVYGSDSTREATLRTFSGGLLHTSSGNYLPYNTTNLPNAMSTSAVFFLAGDVRANEQPGLTAMHTLFVREHNRLANEIQNSNPLYTDEEIYQLARKKVAAIEQVITYQEFLPALLGDDPLPPYAGYQDTVNPQIATEFSTAAYRLGHSMISPVLQRLDANGTEVAAGHVTLLQGFFNPTIVPTAGLDPLFRGLAAQVMQEVDTQEIDALRNFLFGPPGAGGFDLAALNIQRGRDHGIAGYNQVRRELGLQPLTSFTGISSDDTVTSALEQVYNGDIEAVDLWVGGLAEDHLSGSSLGETFTTIVLNQFTRLRDGDPLWYEQQFSGTELAELQATTLKDVIERNTNVSGLQDNVFFAVYPQADVALQMNVPELTLSGSLIEIDVTAQNNGPLAAESTSLTVSVVSGTTLSASGSSAGCTQSGTTVSCALGTLASGDNSTATIALLPSANECFTSMQFNSTVTALQYDANPTNNTTTTSTYYACPGPTDVDLVVAIGTSPSVQQGNTLAATATVTNNGPANASGVTLSINIPTGLQINSISNPTCYAGTGSITCDAITLATGQEASVVVEYNVPDTLSCPQDISLSASTTNTSPVDFFTGNNTAGAITTVECTPQTDLTTDVSGPSQSPSGLYITYQATVTNNGPASATSPSVSFSLPTGVTFREPESSNGCVQNGSTITCPLSTIANGASTTATVTFSPLASLACGTTLQQQATATSAIAETNPSDNTSATLRTEITCGTNETGTSNERNRDTVGRSTSPGSTSGKGTREATVVLSLLCRMNGMDNEVQNTGHYLLASNADFLANTMAHNDQSHPVMHNFTEPERRIICGMKKYMENQDARYRKTEAFRNWLLDTLAKELHRNKEDIRQALEDPNICGV